MRVALTGTPGTGKTTASAHLPYDVVHLNRVIEDEELWTERDEARDSLVVDVAALAEWVDDRVGPVGDEEGVVLESHLAHLLAADRIIVLRCQPAVLESRLRERGESEAKTTENAGSAEPPRALARKARENAESEALDVVLAEAVDRHGDERVYEIDTTDRSPEAVAAEIEAVVEGERVPSAGDVDFTDYLHP